jgi:hypothetical protein
MLKPTIEKLKDARRRIIGYTAFLKTSTVTFPPFAEGKPTPKEAEEDWNNKTIAALERLDRGTIIRQFLGHTFIITPTSTGWDYWIDTFRTSYSVQTSSTREKCEDSCLTHIAQMMWNPDSEEKDEDYVKALPESLRGEVLYWINWQREMKRLRAAGFSDNDARDIIGGWKTEQSCVAIR